MAGLSASSGGGWDYIQAAEPADPEIGALWFDTDAGPDGQGEAKVYDGGGTWQATGYISHDQLDNVAPADHHDPVTVSEPLTRSGQSLGVDESGISLSNLSGYPIGTGDLSFDTATQAELDNHASNATAHHSKPGQTQSASPGESWVTVGSGLSNGDTLNLPQPVNAIRISALYDSNADDKYDRDVVVYETTDSDVAPKELYTENLLPGESTTATATAQNPSGGGFLWAINRIEIDTTSDMIVDIEARVLGAPHQHQI
ncbi:hypothetical protein [Haloarcula sebkhae]|uniref:Uncharacterized protein n=2 Tax=Haloarcula sebkhae TaxID=932660 RepID=A0ACC6VPG6_9EURY|nr:hypothetical protein [Haloarcula sebkhae]GGK63500.1 hypothetical protein GCM10009067_14810 [Haloarcula sebkhae]